MVKKTDAPTPRSEEDEGVSPETIQLAADTLSGDLASFLIDNIRNLESAYRYLPESEQRRLITAASESARYVVERAVAIIASKGRAAIPIRVKKVENDGDKIKVTIEANKEDEHRHALFDAAGSLAFLTVADPEEFLGGEEPQPTPDQGDLIDKAA